MYICICNLISPRALWVVLFPGHTFFDKHMFTNMPESDTVAREHDDPCEQGSNMCSCQHVFVSMPKYWFPLPLPAQNSKTMTSEKHMFRWSMLEYTFSNICSRTCRTYIHDLTKICKYMFAHIYIYMHVYIYIYVYTCLPKATIAYMHPHCQTYVRHQ